MNFRVVFLALAGLFFAGCASYTASVEPSTKIEAYRRYWVKTNFDDNHGIDRLLVQTLKAHGLEAEAGPVTMMPREVEAMVTYRDRWTWDFKNHMTSLEITVQDVRAERTVAVASFVGPASMTVSPLEVVERLVRDLQKAKPKADERPL